MILITGPECSGKTEMAKYLSDYYTRPWIPEYSRSYLDINGNQYAYDDIEKMAIAHLDIVNTAQEDSILDTFLLNYKIWSQQKFNKFSPFIQENLEQCQFDKVLLMRPDIEWEFDPLRENPDDRHKLFDIYTEELDKLGWSYSIVQGIGDIRRQNAINILQSGNVYN
jgi:nicotinamide riboside kinase